VVVEDLAALRGPTVGVVELPHRLLWHADQSVDLGSAWQLTAMYEIVLTEAVRVQELCDWLDAATLTRLWGELYLPELSISRLNSPACTYPCQPFATPSQVVDA
jgi:hypothetical protein